MVLDTCLRTCAATASTSDMCSSTKDFRAAASTLAMYQIGRYVVTVRNPSCPGCQTELHQGASICPSCKTVVAQCSWCFDFTTLDETEQGRRGRTRYVCVRCNRPGVRCRTGLWGGYCNGLARAEGLLGRQLCARCRGTVFDTAKAVVSATLIGLVGGRLRPRR